jgi:hypothetical protein
MNNGDNPKTYHLGKILGQVRDVEVGGQIITLSLEARVERLLLQNQYQ